MRPESLLDSRPHAAQHEPVGIPQARLQPALLFEGWRGLAGMPDAARGDSSCTEPEAAEVVPVVMNGPVTSWKPGP